VTGWVRGWLEIECWNMINGQRADLYELNSCEFFDHSMYRGVLADLAERTHVYVVVPGLALPEAPHLSIKPGVVAAYTERILVHG
jgi:hypothetical protein